jgi:hypothetical protein
MLLEQMLIVYVLYTHSALYKHVCCTCIRLSVNMRYIKNLYKVCALYMHSNLYIYIWYIHTYIKLYIIAVFYLRIQISLNVVFCLCIQLCELCALYRH